MNLLDGIDKSSYSLIFSEDGDTSPRSSRRNFATESLKPHTVLGMKTTLVNGNYSKCDSSSDIESEEQKPLVQSEFKLGVSPLKSNGSERPETTLPSTYNLMGSGNVSLTHNQYSTNPNSCYNIEYVSPLPQQLKGSPDSNELQRSSGSSVPAAGMFNDVNPPVPAKPLPKHNWGPDTYSSNLSTGAAANVNSYSEGQKILPPNYFIKDYSDIFGNIANYETEDVAKLPIISEESKMFLIGLSSNNENEDEDTMENEDQGSSNSPFQSATEEMGGDGDHDQDQDPLLIRPPPKQNVFHQFIRSAKSSKNRMKQSRKHSLKDIAQRDPGSSTALIKEVEIGNDEPGSGPHSPVHGKRKCSIGILLAAISCVFFATSALIVKISSLHPMELLAVRGLIQGILVSPIVISSETVPLGQQ
ncbi:hypothetical protein Ocin01_06420 [Orchesella cincta]|uniref:Uncharacterized protein n=1 Tax=Orchesella cincta TaxID=48709 RepID=A0A1D2N5N8_ORCCI|nr:hypothetical protein Ocin01_06420 [Orchesella cincta]